MIKNFFYAFVIIILFTTFNKENSANISRLSIKKIIIENNKILTEAEIKKDLYYLYDKNLFFLNTKDLEKNLAKNTFVESFEIKKIYPEIIKIKIFEKEPIAIIQDKKIKYYFTNKAETIDYLFLKDFENLPVVFGDRENFKIFFKKLKKINFPIETIKNFYFFESKRWDLSTEKNQIIKLPNQNFEESLKNFMEVKDKANFSKYKIFDYRIKDQLILK